MKRVLSLFLVVAAPCLAMVIFLFPLRVARAAADESRPEVVLFTSGTSAGAGIHTEFSTWSDLTAFFRPSRWKNPFALGGSLSWLNFGAWGESPGSNRQGVGRRSGRCGSGRSGHYGGQ